MDINLSEITEVLKDINIISLSLRIILAMLLGGLIGIERGIKNRPAGFRTYILVCIGSTIVMCTNQYIYNSFNGVDPSRLGAQVVSGIGFLGAGTIIVTQRNRVKGLTTAAGLWAVACIGIALGIGFYSGAIIGTIAIFLTNTVLHNIDYKIMDSGRLVDLQVELTNVSYVSLFLKFLKDNNLQIKDLNIKQEGENAEEEHVVLILNLRNSRKLSHNKIIEVLSASGGVEHVELL